MQRTIQLILISLMITGVCCLIGCDTISTMMNPPQNVVKNMFQAVSRSDYESAKTFCTAQMESEYICGDTLYSWCKNPDKRSLSAKILNVDLYETEGTAVVVFMLHVYGKESSRREEKLIANLVKRNNTWLIAEIKAP